MNLRAKSLILGICLVFFPSSAFSQTLERGLELEGIPASPAPNLGISIEFLSIGLGRLVPKVNGDDISQHSFVQVDDRDNGELLYCRNSVRSNEQSLSQVFSHPQVAILGNFTLFGFDCHIAGTTTSVNYGSLLTGQTNLGETKYYYFYPSLNSPPRELRRR